MHAMRHLIPFANLAPRVAVVRLAGPIGAGGRVGSALSDTSVGPVIERAFRSGRPSAVALVINSPGGSAVQSSLIAARIRRLAVERKLPVHAFVEDAAASGGYWLACAADSIWVDRSSIVGSIGVISAGFGLADLIGRQGIERRVHTAGRSKSFADPFMPERTEDAERLRVLLDDIHKSFLDHVRTSRGVRLGDAPGLFEGEFWTGQRAVELGLADGIGHLEPKLRELYGDKVRLIRHGQRTSLLRRFGIAGAAGAALEGAVEAAQGRALWARLGL